MMKQDPAEQWLSLESAREIFRTGILSLNAEFFRCLRTGAEHEFITIRCGSWVNIIAVTPEQEMIMIRQFRHGTRRTEWEIPGGCIDRTDRTPVEAGIRELAEETGFSGKKARVIGSVSPNPAIQNNLCHTILVEQAVKTAEPTPEPTECIEVRRIPVAEIPGMIRKGEIRHGLVLNALFFYFLGENENEKRI